MIACIQYVCIYVDTCVSMIKETKGEREGLTPKVVLWPPPHAPTWGGVVCSESQPSYKVRVKQGPAPHTWFFVLFTYILNRLQTDTFLFLKCGRRVYLCCSPSDLWKYFLPQHTVPTLEVAEEQVNRARQTCWLPGSALLLSAVGLSSTLCALLSQLSNFS